MTTIEEILDAIRALGSDANTPEALRRRMVAFRGRHARLIADFYCDLRAAFDDLFDELDPAEDELEVAFGAITPELVVVAAVIGLAQPRVLGQPFSPARFACACYDIAKAVVEQQDKYQDPETVARH